MKIDFDLLYLCKKHFPAGRWRIKNKEIHNSTGIILALSSEISSANSILISRPGIGDELLQETVIHSYRELACFLEHALKTYMEEADFIVGMEEQYGVSVSINQNPHTSKNCDQFFSQMLDTVNDYEDVTSIANYSALSIFSGFTKINNPVDLP